MLFGPGAKEREPWNDDDDSSFLRLSYDGFVSMELEKREISGGLSLPEAITSRVSGLPEDSGSGQTVDLGCLERTGND